MVDSFVMVNWHGAKIPKNEIRLAASARQRGERPKEGRGPSVSYRSKPREQRGFQWSRIFLQGGSVHQRVTGERRAKLLEAQRGKAFVSFVCFCVILKRNAPAPARTSCQMTPPTPE